MNQEKYIVNRIQELEELLDLSERKSDILTNLLKEASSEFQQALEKVTVSESNFRAIFENAPEAIYIFCTDTGKILDCNSFAIEWLGYTHNELLSMRLDDISAGGSTGIEYNVRRAVEHGMVNVLERQFQKKDGTIVDAEVTGTLIEYEGNRRMIALVRDITERKSLEEISRYKELFDNVSDPVFINDSKGRFLEVNDVACNCFGYPRRELLHKAIKHLIAPGQNQVVSEMGTRIRRGEAVTFQLEMITRDKKNIPFEFHGRLIKFLGKPAVLSVARDLSVRKKMEEALVRSERLSALGEMASGVAHNYNNLLQMIIASGEAALAKMEAGRIREARDSVKRILEAGRRGADTVRRIKDFTDVGSGQIAQKIPFDIGELLQEAVDLTRPLWKDPQNSGKYLLHLEKPVGCMVNAKASEIYEVLINLIKNAIEAMPDGGKLRIFNRITDSHIHLYIRDNGCGIAENNLERIFEPFFTTKGSKSSGLGLPSSYGIIKRNQGEMTVESLSGKGTCFCVTLPLADGLVKQTVIDIIPVRYKKIRFLLIDDEINILKAMEMFFEDTEIDLITANKASECIKTLEKTNPDVILCDLGMDDLNGWEVGKAVKDYYEKKGVNKVPFILYTGLDKPLDSQKLIESGIDKVVTKPVSCEQLERIIQEIVSCNPSSRESPVKEGGLPTQCH
jgi:PAS domain S-box-containing protein